MTAPLLAVEDLTIRTSQTALVEGASFELAAGSRTGIIGESGSGKTLTALAIMGLLPDGLTATGTITLGGRELLGRRERELVAVRGEAISMIFQEPMTALNPVMRIGKQIAEPLRLHRDLSRQDAAEAAVALLDSVGIDEPERRARAYPHELSGGQRQRAMIAMALSCGPSLVIADEPTTALDVTIQARVLKVLAEQVANTEAALLLITHDLPVVSTVADEVLVLKDGVIVERGPTRDVFDAASDPYTRRLVAAVPPMSRGGTVPEKPAPASAGDPLVEVQDVTKTYRLRHRTVLDAAPVINALEGVSFDVRRGETLGIVGESGSGKSTAARIIMGLTQPTSGRVVVDGMDVADRSNRAALRGLAQMVFQDPMSSLDPRMLVGDVVAEPLRSLRIPGDHGARVAELLDAVSLPADTAERYPHEFSGGQRQRIAIARALAPGPRLLIADEPVSALDMSVQTLTLDLLARLKEEFALTMVFISHDLSVVHEICDRVVVLERGRVVEAGSVGEVFTAPSEAYTRQLIGAIPRLDGSLL